MNVTSNRTCLQMEVHSIAIKVLSEKSNLSFTGNRTRTWQTAPRAAVSKFPIMGNSCRTDDSVFVLKQQKSFQRKIGREGNYRSKKLKRLINQS